MLSRIPSWAVAVVGASIVIVATATSSTLLHQTPSISSAQSEIAQMRREVDRQGSSHLQADQRSTAADSFFAQALGSNSSQSFLLQQAAYQLRGAVVSMWAASGEPVPDEPPEEIATFEEQLQKGDADGYASLKAESDRLRLLWQTRLDALSSGTRAAETRIASLQTCQSWVYLAYVFFNLLGLMTTMCKDLPCGKTRQRGGRRHSAVTLNDGASVQQVLPRTPYSS